MAAGRLKRVRRVIYDSRDGAGRALLILNTFGQVAGNRRSFDELRHRNPKNKKWFVESFGHHFLEQVSLVGI